MNRCKSTGTSWMKLLNRCKKYRDKSVQLTITSIIISHTHAPLQLCIVILLLCSPLVSLQIVIWRNTICKKYNLEKYNTTAAPSWCAQGMCSSKTLVSMSSSMVTDYASVGGAPKAYGSWFVCVYVCISPKNFDKTAKS